MNFTKTSINGVKIISLEKKVDERGFLARTWDRKEFLTHSISLLPEQGYLTCTQSAGTMRGLHYQVEPQAEEKITRCVYGSVYEVVVDVRPSSPTYLHWESFTFKADDYAMLFIPTQVAHAILTLEDQTEFMNFSSESYNSACERGIRYNDPLFNIHWPIPVKNVSEKDLAWKDFEKERL